MKKRLFRTAAGLFAAVLFILPVRALDVSARSAIVMDADSGRVLYERSADRRSLIASTTKIMTGLLVCEAGNLDRTVCVPPEAAGIEGSSMYLRAGEQLTVRELLYGLMLQSGNDAAEALAIVTAGSTEKFVQSMNARAAALGLENTCFANPCGLDDEHNYSTARDLAVLTACAMEQEDFRRAVAMKTARAAGRQLTNHNRLLWQYEGAAGVKTGYTRAAGRILVSAARRNGRMLIAVTICDPDDWRDHAAMLDRGFEAYTKTTLIEAGASLGQTALPGKPLRLVRLFVRDTVTVPMLEGETAIYRLHLRKIGADAAENAAGELEILINGKTAASVPVWYGTVP